MLRLNANATPIRLLLGTGVLILWSALMILGGKTMSPVFAVICGILYAVPLCSLGEWFAHGILYHAKIPGLGAIRHIHHQGHHFTLFPPARYVQNPNNFEFMRFRQPLLPFRMSETALDNFLTKWSQIALHFALGIPLLLMPAWYFSKSPVFFWSVFVSLTFISWLLAHIHGVIHTPRDRWIERQSWFQWLDQHHYLHHIDTTSNMNFMLPICDFLFGTHRWALNDREMSLHPSFQKAKPMAASAPVYFVTGK